MQQLFTKCEEIKREDGCFFNKVNQVTLQLIFLRYKQKTQRKFVDTYGQYLCHLDTTFNTTKYNLRLCLPSVVCFLGKTTLVGCGIAPSEEGKDIDLLLNKLGLKYKEAVVATDRAKGQEYPIAKRSQQQVYHTWHFGVDFQSAT